MKPFAESYRYEYPLTPESLCVDVGAYHGEWSLEMSKQYGCKIVALEPIKAFYDIAADALLGQPNVTLMNCALGGVARHEKFHVQNNSTGIYAGSLETEICPIMSVAEFFGTIVAGQVAVLKLNCEGMEMEILEAIIANSLVNRFDNIQAQFHWNAPDAHKRHHFIDVALRQSHETTWGDDPTFHVNYQRK